MSAKQPQDFLYVVYAGLAVWTMVCVYVIGRYIKRKLNPSSSPAPAPVVQAAPAEPDALANVLGSIGMVLLFPFLCVWVVVKGAVTLLLKMIGDHEFLSSLGGSFLAALILQFVFGWHIF